MSAVILYLALWLASAGAQSSGPMKSMTGCDDVCGIAPEPGAGGGRSSNDGGDGGDDDYYEYAESERVSAANGSVTEEDTRIVNGYEPDDRPWLAYIDVRNGLCGGAILTKSWVLMFYS